VTDTNAGRPGHRSYPKGVRRRQQILDSAIALFAQRDWHISARARRSSVRARDGMTRGG
jgi:AcrR family transcriptional regulator